VEFSVLACPVRKNGCTGVTLWQKEKNATKTLRHKIAQKENEKIE
jgi:hypothetical protein